MMSDTQIIDGCAPFSVKFAVTSEEIDSCRLSFGSNEKSPTWTFTFPGEPFFKRGDITLLKN